MENDRSRLRLHAAAVPRAGCHRQQGRVSAHWMLARRRLPLRRLPEDRTDVPAGTPPAPPRARRFCSRERMGVLIRGPPQTAALLCAIFRGVQASAARGHPACVYPPPPLIPQSGQHAEPRKCYVPVRSSPGCTSRVRCTILSVQTGMLRTTLQLHFKKPARPDMAPHGSD